MQGQRAQKYEQVHLDNDLEHESYDQSENNKWGTRIHLREVPPRRRYNKRYAEVLAKTSKRAQNVNPPLFIPTLTRLRRACFDSLALSLRGLEERIEDEALDSCKHREIVSEATGLLRQMDEMIESEARLLQLENPEYASSCGLSVVHFEKKDPIVRADTVSWIMMSKAWGVESRNVIDAVGDDATASSVLSKYHQQEIKKFMGTTDFSELTAWSFRMKNTPERLPWTLSYNLNGSVQLRYQIAWIWRIIILLVIAALTCFYGVGIIATNTQFNPSFQRYFFWIAIFWSLVSSSLLGFLVVWLGGNKKDAVSALLTGLAIWLVIIQIGQTHLITQLNSPHS